jgi:hypothetical protein
MDLQAPAPCEINVLGNLRLQSRGVCWRYSSLEFMIMHSVYDGGYFASSPPLIFRRWSRA